MSSKIRLLLAVMIAAGVPVVEAIVLPPGFQETIVFSGLNQPTVVRFSPDGRVFVAEKEGRIKIFNSLSDATPNILINLAPKVHNYQDRGLLGLAIHPQFPTQPYIFILYTHDFDPFYTGAQPPRWGDTCPSPPGSTTDGCVVNARLSRLQVAANNTMVGSEKVLLENRWCQQYPSHSIGALNFGPEGALYVSAGDGASYSWTDYGQGGGGTASPTPPNPCDDPPVGRGGLQTPPTAEGGSLRSQDLRTTGDPVTFAGTVLRVDPNTGAAWPDNPLRGGDAGDDRIIAYGLRNPYRFTIRPGTSEVWIGDVGWNNWEEINRVPNPTTAPIKNFGWPCYEGPNRQGGYDAANLNICENLYPTGTATSPYYSYNHSSDINPNGDACPTGGSSISGLAFYSNGVYPNSFQGALFFADYSRNCIYMMTKGTNGDPDLNTRTVFGSSATKPVHLEIGPGGDLYYVGLDGTIRRIRFSATNLPPQPLAQANPTSGVPPLTVQFDASGSVDPNPGSTLFYEWDLNADGLYDDSTLVNPTYTYTTAGQVTVKLRVTDDQGATGTDKITISVGNSAPTATIISPQSTLTWRVGDNVSFSGSASDPQEGTLPPSAMQWQIILHHCDGSGQNCHSHPVQQFNGVNQGNFIVQDHEWYSYLEIQLTVTDSGGLTGQESVSIYPQSVTLTFQTNPSGLTLGVGSQSQTTPFTRQVIVNSSNSLNAPSPQIVTGLTYYWSKWSNNGPANQQVIAPPNPTTYTATYITNAPPSVTITSPANGATFPAPANITINATASDSNGSITKVEFFRGTTLLGTDTTSPYSFAWNNVAAGSYALTARATDNLVATTTSSVVNITVTGSAGGGGLPSPWQHQDIGTAGVSGSASYSSGTFTINGSGSDIWGVSDNFHYVYQPLTGNGEIIARVASIGNTNTWAKVGVMIRQSLAADSPNAAMLLTHSNGSTFQRRFTTAGSSGSVINAAPRAPYWVKLSRIGNTFAGYHSTNGTSWTQIGSVGIMMSTNAYIGLAVTSHNNAVLCTAVVDQVSLNSSNTAPTVSITSPANGATFPAPANITINAAASDSNGSITKVEFFRGTTLLGTDTTSPYSFAWNNVGAGSYSLIARATDNLGATSTSSVVNITVGGGGGGGLPSPWLHQDIGTVGVFGNASHSTGTFTINGSGSDIWGVSDNFHYVYQPLTGDGEIIARVASIGNTNTWAKVGVMIRQSLAADSANAAMLLTYSNGSTFQRRFTTAGSSGSVINAVPRAPYWVKLTRIGNTFAGYHSTNGTSWTQIGSVGITMSPNAYVGLAVTSHNDTVLCTAVIDQVTVVP